MSIKGRVTGKKLIEFLNQKFKDLEIDDYEIVEIVPTRYSSAAIEAGANKLQIKFQNKNDDSVFGFFGSSYGMKELENYIKMGYRIYLKSHPRYLILSNLQLEVTKY